MALENLISQMGTGTKLTDRYSGEYGAPVQDQHIYYAYEPSPPTHAHTASPKHHYSGGSGLKSNASMSALTLLAFLFFLHILQQCIKEHMVEMSTAPVVVMGTSRENYDTLPKLDSKIDKTGVKYSTDDDKSVAASKKYDANPFKRNAEPDDSKMMRINAAEHKPKPGGNIVYGYKNDADKSSFPGFVSAVNDD